MHPLPLDSNPTKTFWRTLYLPEVIDPYGRARNAASKSETRPLDYTHGTVFCKNGKVYCSPNSTRIVDHAPPIETNQSLTFDTVDEHPMKLHQPRWWSEETAYLAFVSLLPNYTGLRAAHSLPSFNDPMEINKYEIVKANFRGYGLEPWRKIAWRGLERRMLMMIDSMKVKYSLPPIHPVVENALVLRNFYRNKAKFFADANRAIKWFSAISAQMTWAIAIATTMDDEIDTCTNDDIATVDIDTSGSSASGFAKRPSWLDHLSNLHSIFWDEAMLQAVRKSMGAFGRATQHRKAGVFLNITDPPRNQYSADWLMEFDVPVYYIWDEAAFNRAQWDTNFAARFAPPVELIQDVITSVQNLRILYPSEVHASDAAPESITPSTSFEERSPELSDEWENGPENFLTVDDAAESEYGSIDISDADSESIYDDDADEYSAAIPLPEPPKTLASDNDLRDVASLDMLSLFRDYYGYVPPLPTEDQQSRSYEPVSDKSMMHLRNFVGMIKEECAEVQPHILHDLQEFIAEILKYTNKSHILDDGPADSWDLAFGNRQYLGSVSRARALRSVVGANDTTYIMFELGERRTVEWNLAMCSPSAAMFVCRLKPSLTEREICRELMRRGIAFHTLLPLPKIRTALPVRMPVDVLPADYKFTRRDYQTYIDFRTELLNNSRTCRAALMRGGIIWRLSLSHPWAKEESVLHGPTKYVRQQGVSTSFDNGSFQDDLITLEELNVICGTYECLTGKGLQTVTMSWWPPYSIWVQCYDYEYWTHLMESRFRQRLRDLDAGTAVPMSKQQWRAWVRGGKITRDAKTCINNASVQFMGRGSIATA